MSSCHSKTVRYGRACIVAAVWLLACFGHLSNTFATQQPEVAEQVKLNQEIKKWIEQLGDPSFVKRQAARAELERIGLSAFEDLRLAESSPNVEIANSAQYLLRSMRVAWALPSDTFEVRRLLKDYNDLKAKQREGRMQLLSRIGTDDAFMALLRLTRFESSENLSKNAALYVMDKVLERPSEQRASYSSMIVRGMGDSQRTSSLWLRELNKVIDQHSTDLEPWQDFVLAERKLLESNSEKIDSATMKRLYRWVAMWLADQKRREEAIAFLDPGLELLGNEHLTIMDDVLWMLDENLPEGVLRLFEKNPKHFANSARMRYLLAESFDKTGDKEAAQKVAEEALNLTVSAGGKRDVEAVKRTDNATFLSKRGLFTWAEAELLRAVALQSNVGQLSPETEIQVRIELSTFYWTGDQPRQAAETIEPILIRAGMLPGPNEGDKKPSEAERLDREQLLRWLTEDRRLGGASSGEYLLAHYYFYRGLESGKNNRFADARSYFTKAVSVHGDNPDFMIAMVKVQEDDEEFHTFLERAIERLEQEYRAELASLEAELANATTRQDRAEAQRRIATACNQLAWLLAGTNRYPEEAVAISERSLAVREDEPVYMDTLARCHFAAGHFQKAVEIQSKAVAMDPHERQMIRQLKEFQAAWDASKKK